MRKLRVYIAGKLNDMAVGYIQNMHQMMSVAEDVRRLGCAVYVPCIDILMGLHAGDYEYDAYFDNSQPWLDVCDALFLVPGWETSQGTLREIRRAEGKDIPVFEDMDEFEGFVREHYHREALQTQQED